MAQNMLFLFFTRILQKYEMQAPEGLENVKIDPIVGFIHYCPSYNVRLSKRKVS